MSYNTLHFDFSEFGINPSSLTQKEKNFLNKFFDKICIDFEEDKSITIETDPEELGCFLVQVIRRFLEK